MPRFYQFCVLSFLFLWPFEACAHGALVSGLDSDNLIHVTVSYNAPNEDTAVAWAFEYCKIFHNCKLLTTFKDLCYGYYRARNANRIFFSPGSGRDAYDACHSVDTNCESSIVCDGSPPAPQGNSALTSETAIASYAGLALVVVAILAFRVYQSSSPGRPAVGAINEPTQLSAPFPTVEKTPPTTADNPTPSQQAFHEPVAPQPKPQSSQIPQIIDPPEGMNLKIKKTTKSDFLGRVVYMIDARLDASTQIRAEISRHRLGGRLVYESDKRQKYLEMAQHRADQTRAQPRFTASADEQLKGAATTFFRLGQAIYNRSRAALALKITVDKLLSGIHVECKDVDELGEAEAAIIAAKQNLEGYLDEFSTFDGQEQIY